MTQSSMTLAADRPVRACGVVGDLWMPARRGRSLRPTGGRPTKSSALFARPDKRRLLFSLALTALFLHPGHTATANCSVLSSPRKKRTRQLGPRGDVSGQRPGAHTYVPGQPSPFHRLPTSGLLPAHVSVSCMFHVWPPGVEGVAAVEMN
jgi:hypothetical protein